MIFRNLKSPEDAKSSLKNTEKHGAGNVALWEMLHPGQSRPRSSSHLDSIQ